MATKVKSEFHKVHIKQRQDSIDAGDLMDGKNTEVYLDDKLLENVVSANVSISAGGFPEIDLRFLGEFEVTGNFEKSDKQIEIKNLIDRHILANQEYKIVHMGSPKDVVNRQFVYKHDIEILQKELEKLFRERF